MITKNKEPMTGKYLILKTNQPKGFIEYVATN